MKIIAFLLLLVTTCSSFTPCCTDDDCCDSVQQHSQTRKEHKTESACSPFFSCNTCAGFVHIAKTIQLPKNEAAENEQFVSNVDIRFQSFANPFWQPPRIA